MLSLSTLQHNLWSIDFSSTKYLVIISDIAALGLVSQNPDVTSSQLSSLFNLIKSCIPESCTVVVPSFTYRCSPTTPYSHESSPSETGIFTEYIRNLPTSHRSLHPVFSFVANGPEAEYLVSNISRHSYGYNSVPHRLLQNDALVLSLGRSPHRGNFFLHLAEVFSGVPYRYTKQLSIPVFCSGVQDHSIYFHFVKYADSDIIWDTNRVVERMEQQKALIYYPAGVTGIWTYKSSSVFNIVTKILARNPYGLLAAPPCSKPWTH